MRQVRESGAAYTPEPETPRFLDFSADPEVVRTVVEGERLTYGHLFNPTFAAEISLIDPLPHQRLAVYDHLLPQTRLRFLLADDAEAGKTIMAGLYIREMLTRRLITRVLIVPPTGLVGNWEHELRSLFNLPFRIVTGSDARTSNPFTGPRSDLLIVSVDTLAGERMFSRLQEAEVMPYDLAVFDEAHKLAANREADLRMRRTDRYRLAEALVGIPGEDERWALSWNCHHLLLLTATPHMGKDFPYYCLWRLLEPDALATIDAFNAYSMEARRRHFLRRTKEELISFDGRPLYPTRISNTLSYDLTQGRGGRASEPGTLLGGSPRGTHGLHGLGSHIAYGQPGDRGAAHQARLRPAGGEYLHLRRRSAPPHRAGQPPLRAGQALLVLHAAQRYPSGTGPRSSP